MIMIPKNGDNIASNSNSSSSIKSNIDNLKLQLEEEQGQQQQLETLSTICPERPNQYIFRQKLAYLRGVAAGGVRLQLLILMLICSCIGKFGKRKK